jgi:hypothetical protein
MAKYSTIGTFALVTGFCRRRHILTVRHRQEQIFVDANATPSAGPIFIIMVQALHYTFAKAMEVEFEPS